MFAIHVRPFYCWNRRGPKESRLAMPEWKSKLERKEILFAARN